MIATRVGVSIVGSTLRTALLNVITTVASRLLSLPLLLSFTLLSPMKKFFSKVQSFDSSVNALLRIPFTIIAPYCAPLQPILQILMVSVSYLRVLLTPLVWLFTLCTIISRFNLVTSDLYLFRQALLSTDSMHAKCTLCHEIIDHILESENIDIEGMDCELNCPFRLHKCIDLCEKLRKLLMEAHEYPCELMNMCPAHNATSIMGGQSYDKDECILSRKKTFPLFGKVVTACEPVSYCLKRIEPFKNNSQNVMESCQLKQPMLARLKRMKRDLTKISQVVMFKRYCGDLSDEQLKNGELCIDKPTGTAFYLYLLECLALFVAFLLSIYAIESDESTDDTQWLTFWMVLILVSRIEGFTEVMLSKYPYYYLMRLVVILVLMCQGAMLLYTSFRVTCTVLGRILFSRKEKTDLIHRY